MLIIFNIYNQIKNFIETTVADNRDIASTYVAGTTFENRDLKVIVLKTPTSNRAIWIDCGIHAREWQSPAACVFIIDELVRLYRNRDSDVSKLLKKYEFHILPLVNPGKI